LIGRADWNDCLNLNCFSDTPGESFQTTGNRTGRTAESVFIAGLLVHIAPDYAALADRLGLQDEAKLARAEQAKMEKTVLEHGWDGEWFPACLRLLRPEGRLQGVRGRADPDRVAGLLRDGRIGVASGHAQKALDSVKARSRRSTGSC